MVNKILHSWSFNIKFMKLGNGFFHKFLIKWPFIRDLVFSLKLSMITEKEALVHVPPERFSFGSCLHKINRTTGH